MTEKLLTGTLSLNTTNFVGFVMRRPIFKILVQSCLTIINGYILAKQRNAVITFYLSFVALISGQVQTRTVQILKWFCTLHVFTMAVQHHCF